MGLQPTLAELTAKPHWSASRFMLFDVCPTQYRERYVDGVALEPTEAMCFGKAVHLGLEAHYRGDDGEQAFRVAWKNVASSDAIGWTPDPRLTGMGLQLLNAVFELQLSGLPEHPFSIDTPELGANVVGAMDLWDRQANVIYDFKTTKGRWSQERAQTERWQPLLYTWAAWDQLDEWPAFEYIVLNRATGVLDRFRRDWTTDEWTDQMSVVWTRMLAISKAVERGWFDCHNVHGNCLECGERWSHDHVCDELKQPRRRIRL